MKPATPLVIRISNLNIINEQSGMLVVTFTEATNTWIIFAMDND
jgi:hypothetical protein